jgi:hypothetical protein
MSEPAYLRRVRTPDPIYEELARQAVDGLEAGRTLLVSDTFAACRAFGVPIDYLLDEIERRKREARPTDG